MPTSSVSVSGGTIAAVRGMGKAVKPASQKQLDLIAKLMDEKFFDDTATQVALDLYGNYASNSKVASSFISFMFRLPRKENVVNRFNPQAGMYRMGDDLYRVKISRTGNWYAEVAVKPTPGSGRKSLSWEYLGKRINLADAEMLSDAEAGKFSGYCVRCNAELTDRPGTLLLDAAQPAQAHRERKR